MADAGHNIGTGFDAFAEEARQFANDCARWAKAEITAENAALVRDLIATGVRLTKTAETQRRAEKKPHEDLAKAVDAKFRPLTDQIETMAAAVKSALSTFMRAEEERRRKEAEEARQRAADEARRAAEAATLAAEAEKEDDPFAAFDVGVIVEEAKINEAAALSFAATSEKRLQVGSAEGVAKATSLRSFYSVAVTDPAALVAHFAKNPDVIAAAEKAANALARTTKGSVEIPGCRVIEDRRVA